MESGQLHIPATLPPEKDHQYPLDRRLGGPHSQTGHYDKEKKSLPLPGIKLLSSSPLQTHNLFYLT